MSGIGPAFEQDGSAAATPVAREPARPATRLVADPPATPADKAAPANVRAAAKTAPAAGTGSVESAAAPATVDAAALPDATTAPLTAPAESTAAAAPMATGLGTAPAKPVATVQVPPARPAASPADAGSLGGLVASLLLIVGLILALGWLARRMPGFGGGAASKNGLRLVASLPVGARERVVVVEVGGTQLLLGVGNGAVRTLHTLDVPLPETATGTQSPFAQVLAQHFGKKA